MYLPNVCLTRNITAITHTTVCRPLSIAWMVRVRDCSVERQEYTQYNLVNLRSYASFRPAHSIAHVTFRAPSFVPVGYLENALFRVAYSCPICASITRKYITYLIAAGEVPSDGRNMLKNCEDRTCSSGDMFADRQTRRQTERRAHHNTRQSSNDLSPVSARQSAGRRIRCRIAWQKQCCIGRSVLEAIELLRKYIVRNDHFQQSLQ